MNNIAGDLGILMNYGNDEPDAVLQSASSTFPPHFRPDKAEFVAGNHLLFEQHKLVAERFAAFIIALLQKYFPQFRDKKAVGINCGGNVATFSISASSD